MHRSSNRHTGTHVLCTLAAAGTILFAPAASGQGQIKKLLPSDGAMDDRLGGVAIDGDILVLFTNMADPSGSNSGAAWVFQKDQGGTGNWGEVKKLVASDGATDDWFGVRGAVSGDTIVIAGRNDDDNGTNSGSAYIFQQDVGGTDNWGQVTKLTASDGAISDLFGNWVDIDGDTVIVGAWFGDDGATADTGAAYIFERDQGGIDNWGEVVKLDATGLEASDSFGWAVGISGNRAVVTAYGDDDVAGEAGAAYVFGRDQGGIDNWGQVTKITASDGSAVDLFGQAVSMDGDTIVVGCSQNDDASPGNINCSSGSAYVFERNQGGADNWGQVMKLLDPDHACMAFFGGAVAIDGDLIAVGAGLDSAVATGAGSAFLYARNEGGADNWGFISRINAGDADIGDTFGGGVAVSGSFLGVSAGFDNETATAAGAGYVFSTTALVLANADCNNNGTSDLVELLNGSGADCNSNGILDACDISNGTSLDVSPVDGLPDECTQPCPWDFDGNGSVGFADLNQLLAAWGACP